MMHWFDGLDYVNGRLALARIGEDGNLTHAKISCLAESPRPANKTVKHKVVTNFNYWKIDTASEYLAAIGMLGQTQERHRVFAFEYDGKYYLIPTLVLAKAFFRPFGKMINYLFKPQGLEQLCLPGKFTPRFNVLNVLFNYGTINSRLQETISINQPFSWIWSFPSAKQLWDSVYAHARSGHLALDLPKGTVRMVIHSICSNGVYHVTDAIILELSTTETPFTFAESHNSHIIFRENLNPIEAHNTKNLRGIGITRDKRLLPRHGVWSLSDEEWAQIEPILVKTRSRQRRRVNPRLIVDAIVEKFGTGAPWSKIHYKSGDKRLAAWSYRQLKIENKWEQVVTIIRQHRINLPPEPRTLHVRTPKPPET